MSDDASVPELELERQGRRLGRPGWWFLFLAALIALPGVVLIILTQGWAHAIGVILVVLAGPPAVVATALLLSSLVARWAARHRSFA
jgi:uncharacterized membrane protein YdbT with pleckstrin-like domain